MKKLTVQQILELSRSNPRAYFTLTEVVEFPEFQTALKYEGAKTGIESFLSGVNRNLVFNVVELKTVQY